MKPSLRPIANFLLLFALLCCHSPSTIASGVVAAWGKSDHGQTRIPLGLTDVKAVAAGIFHGLALKADGTVAAWGSSGYGDVTTNVPPGLSNIIAIAAGANCSLALRANGSVAAWGYNHWGQVNVPPGLSNVRAIAAGYYHSLALKADGTVIAWGTDYQGTTRVPPSLSNVVAIAAGDHHCLVLKSDGKIVLWGGNEAGQSNVPPGLSNITAVAAGSSHNLALKVNGTVIAWGRNDVGQAIVPANLSNVVAIAAGELHSLALRADGTVVAWGTSADYFNYGQAAVPASLSNVSAIAAGNWCNLALVSSGPPRIIQDPSDLSVPHSSNAVLAVTAEGHAPLGFRWYRNGVILTDTLRISGATAGSLIISNAQLADSGSYTVIVSNAIGSVQSSGAALTVINPPIITLQPGGRTVIAGTNITLTGSAAGSPPLSYQWLREGAAIPGATKTSLTMSNVQSSQSGNYSLRVTNVYGMTDSSNALITVLESLPSIFTSLTLTAPRLLPDGSFVFGSSDPAGRVVLPENLTLIEVQASTNLRDWVTLPNACTLTNGVLRLRDPDCENYPIRFYRIVEH